VIIGGFLKHQVVEAHSFVANFATIEPVGHPWSRWFLIELGHPLQVAQQTKKNKSPFVPSKVFELKFAFDFLDDLFKNTTASTGCLCFFSIFSNMRTLNGKPFSLDHLLGVSRLQVHRRTLLTFGG